MSHVTPDFAHYGVMGSVPLAAVPLSAVPRRFAHVGGHRLHYRCEGEGTPAVVFDAAIAASSLSWARVQPEVARFTRTCSYDRAGLAWSDARTTPLSMPTLVEELHQVIKQANLQPPYVLVGHSFGGLVTRAFARAHREEIAGLVFVDPLHPEEWCRPTREQRRRLRGGVFLSRVGSLLARAGIVRFMLSRLSGGAPALPRRVSRLFGSEAANLLVRMVSEVQKLPPDVLPSVQEHWSNPKSFRGMWQHLQAVPECSAQMGAGTDAFTEIPVVVISAERRDSRWVEADAALARMSKYGRHIVSPQSGHWVHLDDPRLLVDVLRDLIVELRKPARPG